MPPLTSEGLLQAATVIAKTTQTIMGAEIACSGYKTITIWFDYVKGDETGLLVIPEFLFATGGTEYQDQSWAGGAGVRTNTVNSYKVTATGNHFIQIDITAIDFIKFTQGGSNNDGTPTGTVAATYTLG